MTDELTAETWFDAIAAVGATVPGIAKVYAGGRGGEEEPKVVPMDRDLVAGPVIVQGYGGAEISAGSWESTEHTLECAIWIPAPAKTEGKAYSEAIRYISKVQAAYPARGKAFERHPALQSAILTRFERIEGVEWGSNVAVPRIYIVVPYEIQAIVSEARDYAPR